jgi:hypothetical protein
VSVDPVNALANRWLRARGRPAPEPHVSDPELDALRERVAAADAEAERLRDEIAATLKQRSPVVPTDIDQGSRGEPPPAVFDVNQWIREQRYLARGL